MELLAAVAIIVSFATAIVNAAWFRREAGGEKNKALLLRVDALERRCEECEAREKKVQTEFGALKDLMLRDLYKKVQRQGD